MSTYNPDHYAANRDRLRKYNNTRKYGLSPEDFDGLVEQQGGRCASCEDLLDIGGHRWRVHIDHCHQTGTVRGVLCFSCNTALGHLQDDPVRAQLLFEYIANHTR